LKGLFAGKGNPPPFGIELKHLHANDLPDFGRSLDEVTVQVGDRDQAVLVDTCKDRGVTSRPVRWRTSNCKNSIKLKQGDGWRFRGHDPNPCRQEHEDLIASIRAGSPLNEAQAMAESTMTGIIGREAVYSGKAVDWDEAMKSTKRLGPEKYEFSSCLIPEVAMPGSYHFL